MERSFQPVYYVYVATDSLRSTLEVGITPDLVVWLEDTGLAGSPDACRYLVYYEQYQEALDGVKREMKLSGFPRWWLRQLVMKQNPDLRFLNESIVSEMKGFRWLDI